jgi:hypothetical protein
MLCPKNARFELRDPDLVEARIFVIIRNNLSGLNGIFTMVPTGGRWFTEGL